MGTVADRYRHLAAGVHRPGRGRARRPLGQPVACEEWTAGDVVGHMVSTSGYFFGLVGRSVPPGPSVDDDPRGAWVAARHAVQAGLEDPETAHLEFDGFPGPQTFEQAVGRFICADVVVHTWDLARATGLDERLDPGAVHEVFKDMKPMEEMMRTSGQFGAGVEVPDDADEQIRLLAFLSRRA